MINSLIKTGGTKSSVIKSIEVNATEISNPLDIANSFNEFFVPIGPELAGEIVTNRDSTNSNSMIYEPNFSFFLYPADPEEIAIIIKKLRNTAAGTDHVTTIVLQSVINAISTPLLCIVNTSFHTGLFANALKRAIVSPIHKAKSKKAMSNY